MWCLTRFKREPKLANDFEVFTYYDLKTHIKDNKYIYDLPCRSYNGNLKNEFQIKIEKYVMLDENSKNKIKLKVQKRLPYLKEKFKQIKSKI